MNLQHYDTREAWLAARRVNHGIGGSDVAPILGISPWAGPHDVWREKVQGVSQHRGASTQADLERGNRWESFVLAEYTAETGREVRAYDYAIAEHRAERWARASPDAIACGSGPVGGVEAKTDRHGDLKWGDSGTVIESWTNEAARSLVPHYATQVYWYLEVTGLAWWDIAAMIPVRFGFPELRTVRVMRDPSMQARILHRVGEWRERHLVRGEMPPVDSSKACGRVLQERWTPDPTKALHPATERETELAMLLHRLREEGKARDLQQTHAKNRLCALLGDRHGLRLDNGAKVTWGGTATGRALRLTRFPPLETA